MSNDNIEPISARLSKIADMSEVGAPYRPSFMLAAEMGISSPHSLSAERELFRRIADEIDREKQSILRNCAYPLTEKVGKPLKDDEDFESWLDRWYFDKPVDDNNEPVDLGQPIDDKVRGELEVSRVCYTQSGFYFNNSRDGSCRRKMKGITYEYGERVGRPKQPVLDADCAPIKVGDVLYRTTDGMKVTVARLGKWYFVDEEGCALTPSYFTHREPDTQERIDGDATIAPGWYCAKYGIELSSGADFAETYIKMTKHLLRRQRELDGRDA